MARGNTATIDIVSFRAQWDSHVPIRALCENFTITRDQVTRLKFVWELAPRHDRRLRFKPVHQPDPTPREIAQACREIQAKWDANTRHERMVTKPQEFTLRQVETPEELRYLEGGE
jgi:hypothetical protein